MERLNKWKSDLNEKVTIEWYASKECLKYERYYNGSCTYSVGVQLLFKASLWSCMRGPTDGMKVV